MEHGHNRHETYCWATCEYTAPDVIFPVLRAVNDCIGLDGCHIASGRPVCDQTLEVDATIYVHSVRAMRCCRRTVFDPLRVSEILVMLALDAIAQLTDHLHEAFELRDSEHCVSPT